MRCLHAYVSGRVQGVAFRHHTRQVARQLGLRGWVRNLPDGRVEVLAEGAEVGLEQLECFLQRGPVAAQVAQVEATWQDATGAFEDFEVRWW